MNKKNPPACGGFFIFIAMKKLLPLLLLASYAVSAQPSAAIQADLRKLYTAFDDIDIDAVSQMLCASDTSALYDRLDHYFQDDDRKFRYVMHTVTYKFGKPMGADGKTYVPVSFRNVVRITYFHPVDVLATQQSLKEKFRAESAVYDKTRNCFLVTYPCRMVAIGNNGKWNYAFADETLPQEISAGCIPESIKNSLSF